MYADDVVRPVDGAKQADQLVGVAVSQDVVGERKVGRLGVDDVAETAPMSERVAVVQL